MKFSKLSKHKRPKGNKMKHHALITILIGTLSIFISALTLSGCQEGPPSSDQIQRRAQEALSAQGNSAVGMPSIVNFQEKRTLKDIIELRDKAIVTITYTQDMNGVLHKLCDSVGYGISAAAQYTNPQRMASYNEGGHYGVVTLPQADPNGLFSPASTAGTWVMCKDPSSSKVAAVYSEPNVIVSPFPLK